MNGKENRRESQNQNQNQNQNADVNSTGESKTTLVSRNITVMGRRTSVRLEPEMWMALREIANRERCTIHDICTLVHVRKKESTSLTAAIRVFLMLYFRAASTEDGHLKAGHGSFEFMKKRARIPAPFLQFFSNSREARVYVNTNVREEGGSFEGG